MTPLTIETKRGAFGNTHTVTGFTVEELERLRKMKDPIDEVVSILDERNGRIGTCWECGYGIYGMSIGKESVCITTGSSCD